MQLSFSRIPCFGWREETVTGNTSVSAGYVSYSPWFKQYDGNRSYTNVQKIMGFKRGFFLGLISIKTILHVRHTFCYFYWPSLHDDGVTFPNVTFFGGRKESTFNFSFFFLSLNTVLIIQLEKSASFNKFRTLNSLLIMGTLNSEVPFMCRKFVPG